MRFLVRVIGVLGVVLVLAGAALFAVPTERIAALATDRIAQETGREVAVNGRVRPTLWPHLGVRAEGLVVGNPDWVEDGPLIAAEALSVRVPWTSVFSGEINIDEFTLVAPQIALVRAADGRESWSFDAGPPSDTPGESAGASGDQQTVFGVSQLAISDGTFLYRDTGSGTSLRLDAVNAEVMMPLGQPASAQIAAVVNGTALEAEGTISDLPALLSGALSPVTGTVDWSGGQARFDGRASTAPALDGQLNLTATDLSPILALAGQTMPALPAGLGRDRIALAGQLTLASEGTAHLRDAQLELDSTTLALALDLLPGAERPTIRGNVAAERVDLSALAPEGSDSTGTAAGGTEAAQGWPTNRIDVSGLFGADADIALAIGQVDLGTVTLEPVAGRVTVDTGRMVAQLDRVGGFGGTVSGQFVVNGRGGLSTRADLLFAGVQLSPLFQTLAGYDRLQGSGSLSLEFLAIGDDMATLMRSVEGQGDLSFGAGAIEGLDIAGMIRNLDTSFQGEGSRTVYDSVAANFTIANGVLQNDDLRLDAPWGEVTGSGTVDLGGQTLNYRVIPGVIRNGDGAASLRVPVLVSGPWSAPRFRPDLEFLAEQELAEEAAALEAEARARLEEEAAALEAAARERASELLGTELPEGATTEDARDALEQRLRGEAEEQLRRLLGQD